MATTTSITTPYAGEFAGNRRKSTLDRVMETIINK